MNQPIDEIMKKEETCSTPGCFRFPLHRYMWKERIAKIRAYEHVGVLCEACAKEVGAWQLPEQKKVEVSHDSK